MSKKTCANKDCKLPFTPVTPWQRFHCAQCRDAYHNRRKQRYMDKGRQALILLGLLLSAMLSACASSDSPAPISAAHADLHGPPLASTALAVPAPYQLLETREGHLWISNATMPGSVTVLEADGTLLATIPMGPVALGLAQDAAGLVWVAEMGNNSISAIDPISFQVLRTLPAIGNHPYGLLCLPLTCYVTIQGDNQVAQFDPLTGLILGRVAVGSAPHSMTADATSLYVANELSHNVSVIDLASFMIVHSLQTPGGFLVTPALDARERLWVTGYHDGHLYVFDHGTLVATLDGSNTMGLVAQGETMWVTQANETGPSALMQYDLDFHVLHVWTLTGSQGVRNLLLTATHLFVCDFVGQAILSLEVPV